MASSIHRTVKKLTSALNSIDIPVIVNENSFMNNKKQMIKYYVVNIATWDEEKHKYINQMLYKTASSLRVLNFLRDMWYSANGMELPVDDEMWNQQREEIRKGAEHGKYRTWGN